MAESFLLGRNAKAYYHTSGTLIGDVGSPTTPTEAVQLWLDDATAVAGNLTDVTLNIGSDYADATTRLSAESGFASSVPVLRNGEVTFEMRWLPDDASNASAPFTFSFLLIEAWRTDGRVAIAFLDQDRSNPGPGVTIFPQGLAANWSVSMEKSEALRDIQRASITLTIADSAVWYRETIVGS